MRKKKEIFRNLTVINLFRHNKQICLNFHDKMYAGDKF